VKKLAVSVIATFAASVVAFGAVNINWFSNPTALDETGAPLVAGSIVQLIKAGGAMGAPDLAAPDFVGGGDTLVDTIAVGAGLAGGADGVFFQPATTYDSVLPTDTLYVRAYNVQSLAGAELTGFWYGNSPGKSDWKDPAGSPPPPPDNWSVEVATTSWMPPIPEPSTVMLALAGLAMIAIRKIRK